MTDVSLDPNLAIQWDPEAGTLDIRQSAIGAFMDCRLKFHKEYVLSLEPDYKRGQRPWSTADTGSLMHEALGAEYDGGSWKLAMDMYLSENGFDPEDHEVAKAVRTVTIMVEGHLDDLAQDGGDVGETTIGIEVPVQGTFTVAGIEVTVHGRIDRLIETAAGIKIIDDWKSVGPLVDVLGHIPQLGRYAVLLRQQTGWKADRVRTTQIRKVLRTKEGPFYSRPWVPLNDAAYRKHADDLRSVLEEIIGLLRADDVSKFYPHVTTECDWKCRVQDLCIAEQHGNPTEVLVDLGYRQKGSA